MVTDHAHLIALNRYTGALLWETEMADWRQNYYGTGAPLVVGDLVIAGISGGDEGVRGFLGGVRLRPPARRCGASGRCRGRASRDPRRGRGKRSITPARPRG